MARLLDGDDDAGLVGDVEYDGTDDRARRTSPPTPTSPSSAPASAGSSSCAPAILPILPTGEYYQVWFVGPDDEPGAPDRISAGTFHPDPQGRSDVRFAAAVDPALYPIVEITAEPGDGDPLPTGPVVLRAATIGE